MEDKTTWTLDEIGRSYIPSEKLGKGKDYRGGDKTSLGKYFTKTYEELFQPMRNSPIHLLELGICAGRSLAMWSDYFSHGRIMGVDVHLAPIDHKGLEQLGAFQNKNISFIQHDIRDSKGLLNKLNSHSFDIVIDDALHKSDQQWKNFLTLFPLVKSKGIYVIEDLVEPELLLQRFYPHLTFLANPKSIKSSCGKLNIQSLYVTENLLVVRKK
jgi:hypothetical protein